MIGKSSGLRSSIKPLFALVAVLLLLFSPCPMKASVKMLAGQEVKATSGFGKTLSSAPKSMERCAAVNLLTIEKGPKVSAPLVQLDSGEGISFHWNVPSAYPTKSLGDSKARESSPSGSPIPLFLKYQKLLLAFSQN